MYSLIRSLDLSRRAEVAREVATFAVALVVAETCYHFHSFSLECLAFLATWACLGGAAYGATRLFTPADARIAPPSDGETRL